MFRWLNEIFKILRYQHKDICAYCGRVKIVLPDKHFDPAKAFCFDCKIRR